MRQGFEDTLKAGEATTKMFGLNQDDAKAVIDSLNARIAELERDFDVLKFAHGELKADLSETQKKLVYYQNENKHLHEAITIWQYRYDSAIKEWSSAQDCATTKMVDQVTDELLELWSKE